MTLFYVFGYVVMFVVFHVVVLVELARFVGLEERCRLETLAALIDGAAEDAEDDQ